MKTRYSLILSSALISTATAAIVTDTVVQNRQGRQNNWSHVGGGVVTASGSTENVPSSRAIDGNYSGVWANGSVTHTADNGDANSWFQVDLGSARSISEITLFNRTDCCGGRLANYSVLASNDSSFTTTVFDSGNQGAAGASATVTTGDISAQYVRVQRNSLAPVAGGSVISIAEIDVIGGPAEYTYSNLALASTASQSSTLSHGTNPIASKAIDGSLATPFGDNSTTHTNPGAGGAVYWETTFASLTDINEIALYNRGDCCPSRLSNFRVSIWDGGSEVWGESYFETANGGFAPQTFTIQEDTGAFIARGDRVRIELIGGVNNASGTDGGSDVLSLREVEIYGVAVPEPSSTALLGLAGIALMFRRRK